MKRLRLYTTVLVLGIGAAMGARYWTPEKVAAPHRINTQSLAPLAGIGADATPPATAAEIAATAANPARQPVIAAPATPPTVTLPDTPLLRSATQAPPIDTAVEAARRDDLYVAPPRSYERPAVTAAPAAPARPAASVPASLSAASPDPIPAPIPIGLRAYEPADSSPLTTPRQAPMPSAATAGSEVGAAADGAEIQATPAAEPRRQVRRKTARTNAGVKAPSAPRGSAGTRSRRVESLFLNPLGVR